MTIYTSSKELQEAIKAYKEGDKIEEWDIEDDLVKIGQRVWRFHWLEGLQSFIVTSITGNNAGVIFYLGEGLKSVTKDKVILDPNKKITITLPAGRWNPVDNCHFCEDYSWEGNRKDKQVCLGCIKGYNNFRLSDDIKTYRGY